MQQRDYRLEDQEVVYIEVESYDAETDLPAQIVICNSVNISASGMQVTINKPLVVGSIHQVCVQRTDPVLRLYLAAEVRWVKEAESNNEFTVGLLIFDSEGTDVVSWKNFFASLCENSPE